MENTTNEPQNNDSVYSDWLLKRIEKTTAELSVETDMNIKIGKGAKLTAYKECLEYINAHSGVKNNMKE